MQIRKIGPQPESQFTLLSNSLVRDVRLSYRARGVMATMLSHEDGFHVNAETLSDNGTEGRDAIRTAMNELIEVGYLRRVRHQGEDGQWRTDLNVYPYGDAPPLTDSPTPENPSSANQSSVDQSSIEDQEEELSTSPSDAAGDHSPTEVGTGQQQESSQPVTAPSFPVVEQRKLTDWFGVGGTAAPAWVAAWEAAHAITSTDLEYDPQAHLAIYLSRCREERRSPRSDLWLRFFIEDRAKHIQTLALEADKAHAETPQEREDRLNKSLPSTEWGAPVETGAGA